MRPTPPTRKAFVFAVFAISFLTLLFPSAIHQPAFAATQQSYPPDPIPGVNVSVNTTDVFLGSNFTILATFDNTDTDDTGYGPFIDLYIPHSGEDGLIDTDPDPLVEDLGPNPPLDGIFPQPPTATEYTATYDGFALNVTTLTFPDQGADGRGCVNHPLALDTAGLFRQVCGVAGDQLVVIELPFGSFTPDQPAVTVEVPAFLSELASINDVLNIRARGGFQFGTTPTVDWCCTAWNDTTILSDGDDADTWTETAPVNPSLVTIDKSSAGETPTGPNFPRTYTIEVDIATGQPVTNAQINDVLPANIIYQNNLTFNPTPDSFQEPNAGNGFTLQANYDSLTGVDGNDIEISFDYYLGDILNSDTGNPLGISNQADFTAEWVPIDPRDQEVDPIQVNPGPGVGTVTGVAFTSGKGTTIAVNQGDADITPGDILRHTIHFVVSDYFALDLLQITEDVISDGHHFYNTAGYEPTLRVDTNGGSDTVDFDATNYTVTCNYSGGPGSECTADDAGTNDGTTTLTFDVSQEMIDSSIHPEGQLLGGLVTDGGTANDGISEAWVTYYTVVLDAYTDQTGELSLDSNDSISNSYEFSGRLLDTTTCETPTPGVCADDLGTTQTDSGGTTGDVPKMGLTKTLYAINGALCDSNPCDAIAPADEVTYRLSYTLVSGDFEQLTITDFLPLPIFHVDDPDEDGSVGPNWSEDTTSPVIPLSGYWMRGPNDTQGAGQGIDPVTSINTTNNTLTFDFGTYSDTNNNSLVIDLLFTAEVSNDPFADGLRITNQAQQSDQNTSTEASTDTDIIQVTLTEPVLTSEKSAVSTDNPYVTANVPLPIIFTEPGHPEWGPWNDDNMDGTPDEPFNSEYLENNGGTVNADITGVDGNDMVKFAIIIQNVGSSENGAFDIALRDKVPAGYLLPGIGNEGANLQVFRGDGTELTYSYVGLGGSFFIDDTNIPPLTEDDYGIRIDDPPSGDPEYGHGACQGHDDTNGKNVIIVTYDLKINPNLPAGQFIENYGEVTEYAGSEGGENHLEEPDEDVSSTTGDAPAFEKVLVGTSVTSPTNAVLNQAVVGEQVTYQLRVTLPEGTVEDLKLHDDLHTYAESGLAYVGSSFFYVQIDRDTLAETPYAGSDITFTGSSTPNVTDDGTTVDYDFGTLTNADNDNSKTEVMVVEVQAVVLNLLAIQSGDTLRNQAAMTYDTYTWNEETQTNELVDDVEVTDHADTITVIEPDMQITKTVYNVSKGEDGSYDAGDTIRYTYVIEHTGDSETDAYDLTFTDTMPYDSVVGTSKIVGPFTPGLTDSKGVLDDSVLSVTGDEASGYVFSLNTPLDLELDTSDARVITITLEAVLYGNATSDELIANLGEIAWTSMDGDVQNVSSENANSDERTGGDGIGTDDTTLNNYAAEDDATFNVILPEVTKTLLGTELDVIEPVDDQAVIGEKVYYQVDILIPQGKVVNLRLQDILGDDDPGTSDVQNGLIYVLQNGFTTYNRDTNGNLTPTSDVTFSGSTTATITDSGRIMSYNFGTVTNANRDHDLEQILRIVYTTVVLNDSEIQSGDSLKNALTLTYDTLDADGQTVSDQTLTAEAAPVTVIEPEAKITKSVYNVSKGEDGSYEAGDRVRYTYVIEHTGNSEADAYDLNFIDHMPYDSVDGTSKIIGPWQTSLTDSKGILDNSILTIAGSDAAGYVFSTNTPIDLELDSATPRVITITLEGQLYNDSSSNELFENLGEIDWSSMNGDVQDVSTENDATDERTGADGVGGGLNNYAAEDAAVFSTIVPEVDKVLLGTQLDTADNLSTEAVIGETITYRLDILIPQGKIGNFRISDNLRTNAQDGLAFVSEDSFTFYNRDSGGNLTPAANITHTNSATPSVTDSGRVLGYDLGTVTNANRDSTIEQILRIEYTVVVLNIPAIQSGDNLRNAVTVTYDTYDEDGNLVSDQTTSDSAANVSIIEPTMQVTKTAYNETKGNNTEWDAGDDVRYTYEISLANNQTDAYDFYFYDDLPYNTTAGTSQLVSPAIFSVTDSLGILNAADFEIVDTGSGYQLRLLSTTPSNERDFTVAADRTITLVVTGTIYNTAAPGETLDNAANITWTSLDGDITDVSSYNTGSDERTGANGPGSGLNNYADEAVASVKVDDPGAYKALYETDKDFTSGNDLAVGETATFLLRVTMPEGYSPSLNVTDVLPDGLQYASGSMQLITTVIDGGDDYSTYLADDFSGTLTVNGINDNGGGSGADIVVSFGAINVAIDNNYDNNSFLLKFDAVLLNQASNQDGVTLTNGITTQIGSATPVSGTGTTVDVVEPVLDIAKVVDDNSPNIGATVEFTITVEHNSASKTDAFELEITDVIPDGLTYVTDSASPTASYNGTTHTLTWDGGDLTNDGSTLTLTYQATVDGDTSPNDALINDAVVTWTSLDGTETGERTGTGGVNDHINDTDVTVTVTNIDLAIEKDDGETSVTPGSTLSYTINYYNNGNGDASGVEITETVPTYTSFSSADSTSGWSCSGSGDAGDTCTFSVGTLRGDNADDGSITFAVTMDSSVPNDATQVVNNTSIADDGSNGPEPTTGDNQDSDTDTMDASVDISISKTDGQTDVDAGATLTYTLTVTNEGDRDALDVYVTDVIPEHVLFDSAGDNPDGAAATYTSATRTVTWPAFDLGGGDSVNLTVVVDVLDPFPLLETYTITNQASVVNADDTDNSNNSDNDVDNVDDSSALYKTIVATNEPGTSGTDLAIGEIATYALRFTLPEGTFDHVLIVDKLPAGMYFAGGGALVTTAADSYGLMTNDCASTFNGLSVSTTTDNEMRIAITQIVNDDGAPTNNTCMITFDAIVVNDSDNQNGDTLTNTATVTIDGGDVLATGAIDVDLVEPDLTVTKAVDSTTLSLGDTLTYTITVEHTGDSTENAYDVVVSDVIPSGLTYVANSITTEGSWTMEDSSAPTLSWRGDLPLGDSVTLTYQVEIDSSTATPGDTLTNDAEITWTSLSSSSSDERDGSGGVNDYFDSTSKDVTYENIDLSVSKDDGVSAAAPGNTLIYQISYANNGNVEATNVVLTETVPANTTFDAANSTAGWVCTPSGAAGDTCTYNLGTLAAMTGGTPVAFAVTVDSVVSTGITDITNEVSIADDGNHGTDPTLLNNEDNDIDTLNAAPDLSITKTDGVTDVNGGDSLTYTLTVKNVGNQDAEDVTVTDVIPLYTLFDSAGNNPDGAAATFTSATRTVSWPAFDLAGGASIDLTVTIDVVDPFPISSSNTITNQTTVSNAADTNSTNNSDTDEDNVDNSDSFTKSVVATDQDETSGTNVAVGEEVTYAIRFTLPEGTHNNVVIFDNIPTGMSFTGTSQVVTSAADSYGLMTNDCASTFSGASVSPSGTENDFAFTFAQVINNDDDWTNNTCVLLLDLRVENNALIQNGSTLTNLAEISIDGGAVLADATADVTVVEPELTVTKESDITNILLGQKATYTITVEHTGDSTENAYDVIVTDVIPSELTYVPGSMTTEGSWTMEDSSAPTLIWRGDLPLGDSVSFTYQVEINSSEADPGDLLTNNVNALWTSLDGNETYERNGSGGVNDYNASTSDDIFYTNMDLYVAKNDGVTTAAPGDILPYTITYGNSGNTDATNVVLTETVPDNTTFNAANSSVGWSCAGSGGAGDTCTMALGTLLALNGNASAVLFAVTVDNTLPGGVEEISNTVRIADDGSHGTDPTPTNNSDTDTDTLNAAPDISIQKDNGVEVVAAGSTLTYTLTVENAGAQDAAGVSVKDTLPAGASFVSAGNNPDGAAASYDSGTHSVTWPGFDLSAGAKTALTVTVQLNDPLPAGTMSIYNMAEAHDDGSNGADTDNSNNTATDEDLLSTLSKSVIDTSEITTTTGNGVEEVTIGEVITYQMTFEVPVGSVMSDVVLQDTLGLGLTYLDCVSITPSGANLTTDVSGTPSNDFSGVCSGAAVTDVPDPANPSNVIGQGRRVTFDFGNVANTDVVIHSLTVTYRTVALDVPENVTSTHLDNDVILNWGGGQLDTTGTPELEIVEPDLTLTKEIDRNTAAPGTVVTYTIRVSHTSESRSDAFDVVLTDILPAGLDYVPGSLTAVSGPTPGTITDNTAPNLQVIWPHIARGQVAVVSFQATVIENRHGVEVVNSANVGWSSLPGDVSTPQSPHNPTSTERAYDPADLAGLYTSGADASFVTPALPETGFAPGVVTRIPEQPDQMAYTQIGEMQLEIPSLGVAQPVTGIPLDNGAWDLTWLWNEAGYLEGTAFPGTAGNSAITGHVYLPNGAPGPFVNLHTLMWGDKIILTFNGQQYIYEVREVRRVTPDTLSVIDHQENPWLTLITCQGFQKDSGQYAYRIAVKAVLVQVTPVP